MGKRRYFNKINKTLTKLSSIIIVLFLITTSLSVATSRLDFHNSKSPDVEEPVFKHIGEVNNALKPDKLTVHSLSFSRVSTLFKGRAKVLPGLYVYTNYSGIEKRTKLTWGMPKSIDVDEDGKKDISVSLKLRPEIVRAPTLTLVIVARLTIERLNDKIKMGELEVAGELSLPRIMKEKGVRFGYYSPEGEEIPKKCIVSYAIVPHFLSLRKKPEHLFEFNPISEIGKTSQLMAIVSIEDNAGNVTTVGINYNPMVKSVLTWGRTKMLGRWRFTLSKQLSMLTDTTATIFFKTSGIYAGMIIDNINSASFELELRPFSRYGGHLYYKKESLRASGVDLFIQTANMSGSLSLHNLPPEISASWLLRKEGYIKINTYSGEVGRVEATVENVSALSFDPQTKINLYMGWSNITKEGISLVVDADVYLEIAALNIVSYQHENDTVSAIDVIKNATLHLEGKANIDAYVVYNEIKQGKIGNRSEVDITVEDANMYFHADDSNFGMASGPITLSLDVIDTVTISIISFSAEKLADANASWLNASILINATEGYLHLHTLDVGYISMFGHTCIKDVKGIGLTKIYIATIPIYYFTPIIITNAPNTNLTLGEFYLEFYDFLPISLYDAQLTEGTCEINIKITLTDLIFVELANGSNLRHFGVRIGREQGWGKKLGLPADILPYVFIYFNHPIDYLKVHWFSYGPWNSDDWELNGTYYTLHAYDHNYFLFDTHNNSERLKIGLAMPNNTFGIFIDNKTAIRADNFKLEWNLTDIDWNNLSIVDLMSRISLDGYLNLENIGDEVWLIVNGEYIRLDQFYGGYNITVNKGHIRIGGAKAIILNQTISDLIAGADVTIAGNFSLDTDDGAIDIWFNSSGLRISGSVNFTVKDFYLSIGENFSMSAELFTFALDSEADGSIAITPTPSGSARVSLKGVTIILENASITFKGKIPIPNILPEATIDSPADGATVNGIVEITGHATDADGTVELVQVRIDGGEWYNASYSSSTGEWSYSWNTNLVPNGEYRIEVRCFDGIDYSNISTVNVTVDNTGANWRPTVSIDSPADGEKVEGLIQIKGTASDLGGTVELVQVQIDDGEWRNATGTASWTYEWNTTGLVGKHTIKARCTDNEGTYSAVDSITVIIKMSLNREWAVEFELEDSYIDIDNLQIDLTIEKEGGGTANANINIDQLNLNGEGDIAVDLGPGGFIVKSYGWEAALDITILLKASATFNGNSLSIEGTFDLSGDTSAGPLDLLLNKTSLILGGDFGRDAVLDIDLIGAHLIYNSTPLSLAGHLHFDIIGNSEGFASIVWNETGLKSINADFDSSTYAGLIVEDVLLHINASYLSLERFAITGTGSLDISNDSIEFIGNLNTFAVDNLNLVSEQRNFSFDINATASGYVDLLFNLFEPNNFSFSSEGVLEVNDLSIIVESSKVNVSVYAREIDFNATSYLHFEYIEDALGTRCLVTVSGVYIHDLYITYNNLSGYIPAIGFEGTIEIFLSSLVHFEKGDDWFRVIIEGGGSGYASVHAALEYNGTIGGIDAILQLQNSDENFTVYVYNLSGKPCFEIDGSALISIKNFHIWYSDIVDLSIPTLNISFVLEGSEKSGSITIVGATSLDIDTQISLNGKNLTIAGNFQHEGGSDTNLTISWDQSGITGIGGAITLSSSSNITITGMAIGYGNLSVEATSITMNGSMNFEFSSDETNVTFTLVVEVIATIYQLSVEAGGYTGGLALYGSVTFEANFSMTITLSQQS